MIRKRNILAVVGAAALSVPLFFGATATAETVQTDPNPCKVEGWFVNDDEKEREPTRTYDGFVFEGSDLIHRATNLPLRFLKPGSFTATPAPDQPSFFSVEVRDLTTDAYGTLRWDKVKAVWNITISPATKPEHNPNTTAGFFENADPVALLDGKVSKWGKFTGATKVVSFGVGYTASPVGQVKTTVTEVRFIGKVYGLGCVKPTASPTATPTKSPTTSPTPTKSPTSSPTATPTGSPTKSPTATPSSTGTASPTPSKTTNSPIVTPVDPTGDDEELPVTGASVGMLIAGAVGVTALGTLLVIAGRRRKRTS